MGRVFSNGPGDLGSISGRVIPKTLKMVLDTSLLSTQHYKVRIKGKVEKSGERSSALPYTSVWKLLKREPSGRPLYLLTLSTIPLGLLPSCFCYYLWLFPQINTKLHLVGRLNSLSSKLCISF